MNGAHHVSHDHFVQFYRADEPLLNRNVASFFWDALLRGDGLLVIATPERRESLSNHLTHLGADVALAQREGQLAMLDAQSSLLRFMVDGVPVWEAFEQAIPDALQLAIPRTPQGGVCAYGEMVGVLWEAGETEAAIQLEEYWNRLLRRGGIRLFCGYPIDVFAKDFRRDRIDDVLSAHTHVLPTGPNGDLSDVLNRAIEEFLGSRAGELRQAMKAHASCCGLSLPEAERAILWLRSNLPDDAEQILASAREHYEASHVA